MNDTIKNELVKTKTDITNILGDSVTDDRAFSYLTLKYFYQPEDNANYHDMKSMITDGANDGGIDYVVYDDDTPKILIIQSKMTDTLDPGTIISELCKMSNTVDCFMRGNTGAFNADVKRELQNAIDRLPDENSDNIEYVIFTTAEVNESKLYNNIDNGSYSFSRDMVTVYSGTDIEKKIISSWETIDKVDQDEILLDKAHNVLEYSTGELQGALVNASSNSIRALYNKYADKGLFDLNIRKFIKSKIVDDGINKTLNSERDNFWFLNNGLIIACDDYDIDGNKVKLYGFSIVNGGQTTTLIGKYKGNNSQEFYVPCKIVAQKDPDKDDLEFFSKIAEATNSQKPIFPRDLKSNSPEMKRLKKWLGDEDVFLEIKRGDVKGKQRKKYKIKNDELGQLILSFVHQKPGSSRSGKKNLFENQTIYNQIFRQSYEKSSDKKAFILDLIDLNERFTAVDAKLKAANTLQPLECEVLKNSKQALFAIMGVLYMLKNDDIEDKELLQDRSILKSIDFTYGAFLSNYKDDDIDDLLEQLIVNIVELVTEEFEASVNRGSSTSVSNFLKTDKKYYDEILVAILKAYTRKSIGKDIKEEMALFAR